MSKREQLIAELSQRAGRLVAYATDAQNRADEYTAEVTKYNTEIKEIEGILDDLDPTRTESYVNLT